MEIHDSIIFAIFIIYGSAALMATLALFTRQSLLVAYMILGAIIGPYGLKLVGNFSLIKQTGDVGIIFLLFLLGLNLPPKKLWDMLGETSWVTFISSLILAAISFLIMLPFGYSMKTCVVIAAAMMFSSTIIALKLLPTTVLHHRRTGEVVISILLLQDIIAIIVLILIHLFGLGHLNVSNVALTAVALPLLFLFAYVMQRFVLIKLFKRFGKVREYIFLVAIGWCLLMAVLAESMGLSGEIGAFMGGVAIAVHPISQYIAESLKPLRDFFLVLFFFSIGAHFNYLILPHIILPAMVLAIAMLILKPLVYRVLLRKMSETTSNAWEVGWRLGQISEFALLIVYLAENMNLIDHATSDMVQAAAIITFIVSSYLVVIRYQTPLSFSSKLRRE
jgi:Kef-type K+ transport system membrane component KefB